MNTVVPSSGDTLVITKLDRACRSVKNLVEIAEGSGLPGVEPDLLDQGIDTGTDYPPLAQPLDNTSRTPKDVGRAVAHVPRLAGLIINSLLAAGEVAASARRRSSNFE
jgi:hypothetical protein